MNILKLGGVAEYLMLHSCTQVLAALLLILPLILTLVKGRHKQGSTN